MKSCQEQPIHRVLVIDDNRDIHQDFQKILCGDRSGGSALEDQELVLFGEGVPKVIL